MSNLAFSLVGMQASPYVPMRVLLEKKGYIQSKELESDYFEVLMDDGFLRDSAMIIAYDRDLDKSFEQWLRDPEHKWDAEPVSVYTKPLDQVIREKGTNRIPMATSKGALDCPALSELTQYVPLPFERADYMNFNLIKNRVYIPMEVCEFIYLTHDEDYDQRNIIYSISQNIVPPQEIRFDVDAITFPLGMIAIQGAQHPEYYVPMEDKQRILYVQSLQYDTRRSLEVYRTLSK